MRDMRVDEIGLDTAEDTTKKMKFSIKDFFGRCDQIRSFLRIWSHLLKKSLMENFIFVQQDLKPELDLLKGWITTSLWCRQAGKREGERRDIQGNNMWVFFMKTCTSEITEINLHSISYWCFLSTEFYAYIFKELNILAYEYGEDF